MNLSCVNIMALPTHPLSGRAPTRIEQHRYHQWQFFMPCLQVALHGGYRIAYEAESHMFVRR